LLTQPAVKAAAKTNKAGFLASFCLPEELAFLKADGDAAGLKQLIFVVKIDILLNVDKKIAARRIVVNIFIDFFFIKIRAGPIIR